MPGAKAVATKSVSEMVALNLENVAQKRLMGMSEQLLGEILQEYERTEASVDLNEFNKSTESAESVAADVAKRAVRTAIAEVENHCASKDELIKDILALKAERKKRSSKPSPLSEKSFQNPSPTPSPTPSPIPSRPTHELPDGKNTKLLPSGEDGVALEVQVVQAGQTASTRVAKERHELRVCSFNSLKLRTGKAGLEEQWLMLIATLATFDVVLVQEVPYEGRVKDVESTRAFLLKKAFEHHSGDEWSIVLSEPSGPGNLEVHVALVRHPIEVLASCTNFTANGTTLDHAPLTVKFRDPRFRNEGDRTWVATSVHFPPKTRAKDRDAQIQAFLKEYETQSAFRLDTPMTEKGAKDAKVQTVHHLVCGDFNVFVGDERFELGKRGFSHPMLGEHVSTSAGACQYDNVFLSKFAGNKFALSADVLELQMARKGEDGLSDHSPIAAKIKDVLSTKEPKQPKECKESKESNESKDKKPEPDSKDPNEGVLV